MTLIPDTVNNRQILYLEIKDDLQELQEIDLQNWVLFVIEDDAENPILSSFAELCIDKELLYMTAVGKACSKIDDLFDEAMVAREAEGGEMPSWMIFHDDVLMTSWDENFNEGFWFITTIDTVVVANMTSTNYLPIIEDLSKKISNGWLPSS